MSPSIFVLIPAYNAAGTIADVVDRIPGEFRSNVVVVDDGSTDRTFEIAERLEGVIAVRHERNKGYGGAQATLYKTALARGAEIMVMLHSDGGHRPEELPDVVGPLFRGEADVVIGSRIVGIVEGAAVRFDRKTLEKARRGAMPTHVFLANLVLSKIQNLCYGTSYSSFHEGFRACTASVLSKVPFEELGTGYLYDTEFLVAAHDSGAVIEQVPVSTHYEPGSSAWKRNFKYGMGILRHALAYRFRRRR